MMNRKQKTDNAVMPMRGIRQWMGLIILTFVITVSGTAFARSPEISKPIVLTEIQSSDTDVAMHIYGALLEEAGYRVKYQSASYSASFTAVTQGDLHAVLCWETTWDLCKEALDTDKAINAGSTGVRIREGWWYPDYLEETCPGLPDWKALENPDCIESLATADTSPSARFVAAPSGWVTYLDETIDAFDFDIEPIPSGSSGAMFASMKGAIQREQPVIGWAFQPHWFTQRNDGGFIDFPKYEEACHTDPEWGPIEDATHDCAPPTGYLWKIMNADLADEAPYAARIFRLLQLNSDRLAEAMGAVDVDGKSYEEVADQWMKENRDIWENWL